MTIDEAGIQSRIRTHVKFTEHARLAMRDDNLTTLLFTWLCITRTCRYVNNCDHVYTIERGMARLQKAREMNLGICPICGGKTVRKSVDLTESIKGKFVIIKKVKAEVCSQCGERLYSESEMQKIDAFLHKVKSGSVKPMSKKEVEVYSLGY